MTRILAAAAALALLVPAPSANGLGPAISQTVRLPVATGHVLPSRPLGQTFLEPGQFSPTRAFDHVRQLAGAIGPRPAGSSAYRRAARYV